MSAYLDSPGIKHQEQKPKAAHKQGRYVMQTDGYLYHQGGELIDLHNMLTQHQPNVHLTTMPTGVLRASGINPGSFLVVDRAMTPQPGDMVYVRYNGVAIIRRIAKKWLLVPDDRRSEGANFIHWRRNNR